MAGLAHPAKRQLDAAAGAIGVDEDLPTAHGARHAPGRRRGPDAGDKAVFGAVGDGDGPASVSKGWRQDRAKDLVLRQRAGRIDRAESAGAI